MPAAVLATMAMHSRPLFVLFALQIYRGRLSLHPIVFASGLPEPV